MSAKRLIIQAINVNDVPGSMQCFLIQLAAENINLNGMIICSGQSGKGTAYLSAIDNKAFTSYLKKQSIASTEMAGFLVSGKDRVGAAANALDPLSNAGINGVAGAAMVCENKFGMLVVVKASDGDAAEKVLS